ncbi:opine metallophore biosynthesis dehydrogenase [Paenibacillus sp. B01]|uniref:opine metallophore biosynthesis dehydrogenase n=1 Tax=Paenibacillus sp. B01 TaxID=2660554 RepID=UPI00129A4AA8|nr:opine metallophore biosynthesis dehydrogenase [Paenibacillus sp. B01]QGG57825.1 DUF2338 family protein [Paenibacillus sp. B01]
MSALGRVLVLGTGPAAVQLAVLFRQRLQAPVGMAGRRSLRSEPFFAAAQRQDRRLRAEVQNRLHERLAGECALESLHAGIGSVEGSWDTAVLAVTADAYASVLEQLPAEVRSGLRRVVLVSPTFGSAGLVRQLLKRLRAAQTRDGGSAAADPEIISFSTYLGDTRWSAGGPSAAVLTTGVKRKVYAGSTQGRTEALDALCAAWAEAGVRIETLSSPLEAETRNISLYVHPPLFFNAFSLDAVFGRAQSPVYVYKLFPEGPITPALIRDLHAAWLEIGAICEALSVPRVNLLKFMTDDCYPVRPESLSRLELDRFPELDAVHQQYLLYVRYASLLIDPYSSPDEQGRYFDFSAVPIRRLFVDADGRWELPRMPKEDVYRTRILQGIARRLGVRTPTVDRFLSLFDERLADARQELEGQPLSEALLGCDGRDQLELIVQDLPAAAASGTGAPSAPQA